MEMTNLGWENEVKTRDNLIFRMKNGMRSINYKPVDYQQLHTLTEAKKLAAASTELKIRKAVQTSKISKEQQLIKQHRQVWWQEHQRLKEVGCKVESEIKSFFKEENIGNECLSDLKNFEQELSEQWCLYLKNVINPIQQLIADLKYRQHHIAQHSHSHSELNSVDVLEEVDSVKKQLKAVFERLSLEQQNLENNLSDWSIKIVDHYSEERRNLLSELPMELEALECPYPDLKSSIFNEFCNFTEKYQKKLQDFDLQLEDINRNFQLSEEEHWMYQAVLDQYPGDLCGRRTLYLDMLQRHFPHKSRHALVEHEKCCDQYHFAREQRRVLISNWNKNRRDFIQKAVLTLAEACAAHEMESTLAKDRRKQLDLCADLKAKVNKSKQKWRQPRSWKEREARAGMGVFVQFRGRERERAILYNKRLISRLHEDSLSDRTYLRKEEGKESRLDVFDLRRPPEQCGLLGTVSVTNKIRSNNRRYLLCCRMLYLKKLAVETILIDYRKQRLDKWKKRWASSVFWDQVIFFSCIVAWTECLCFGNEATCIFFKFLFKIETFDFQQIQSQFKIQFYIAIERILYYRGWRRPAVLPDLGTDEPGERVIHSTNIYG
ncbi:hypothetical protein QTO34_002988 [Cnephaeus nilssonii]|uniref:Coiled-coil domain containing 148 n=1 Tax=Cnephaeus nilssonii TaxID=3371016 RepID=A0AA40HU07_CNENI|nr:hypothetical protein QTO34_002988 [Eptesicus nilssonii]